MIDNHVMDPRTSLKTELKTWEASFQSAHGREPNKADIKAEPNIAAKYKEYNKLKVSLNANRHPETIRAEKITQPKDVQEPLPSSSSIYVPSSRRDSEDVNTVFKTPTKPKQSQRRSSSINSTSDDHKRDDFLGKGKNGNLLNDVSPSKRHYVVANSPSRLRALAAAHSTTSSRKNDTLGSGGGSSPGRSPKPNNPFRSDTESNLLTQGPRSPNKSLGKKSNPTQRLNVKSGESSSGLTAWEKVFAPNLGKRSYEVSHENGISFVKQKARADSPEMEDEEEGLGPSPVKRSMNGAYKNRYKSLFMDDFSTTAQSSSSSEIKRSATPKIFEDEITNLRKPSSGVHKVTKKEEPVYHDERYLQKTHGVKRPSEAREYFDTDLPLVNSAVQPAPVRKKNRMSKTGSKGNGEDVNLDDGSKVRPKVTSQSFSRTFDQDMTFAIDTDEEDISKQSPKRNKIIVHPRGSYRHSKKEPLKETAGNNEDMDVEDAHRTVEHDSSGESDSTFDSGLYLHRPTTDLLSMRNALVHDPNLEEADENPYGADVFVDKNLSPDLISTLSISASPIRKTNLIREKHRDVQVRRLLQEPSVRLEKKGVLTNLVDQFDAGLGKSSDVEDDEDQFKSDDDWASEAEGWKDLGDGAMDGYDDWDS